MLARHVLEPAGLRATDIDVPWEMVVLSSAAKAREPSSSSHRCRYMPGGAI